MPIYLGSRRVEEHVQTAPTLREGVRQAKREDRQRLASLPREAPREKRALAEANTRVYTLKTILDQALDGLTSLALITLLLYTTTQSLLITGIALMLRHAFTLLAEALLPRFAQKTEDVKRLAYTAGVIAGFLFILTGAASIIAQPWLLTLLIILFSTATGVYARASRLLLPRVLPKHAVHGLQRWLLYYGVIIASMAMILSSFAFQTTITFSLYFTLTGVLLILAAYLTYILTPYREEEMQQPSFRTLRDVLLSPSPFARLVLLAGSLTGALALAYPPLIVIDAYETFNQHAGAVLILFAAALLTSTLSPLFFDQLVLRKRGRTSYFLLGLGFILAVPAAFILSRMQSTLIPDAARVFFPHFILFLGMAGFGMSGIALSRLLLDIFQREERHRISQAMSLLTAVITPILTLLILGLAGSDLLIGHFIALLTAFIPFLLLSILTGRLEEERFRRLHVQPHVKKKVSRA